MPRLASSSSPREVAAIPEDLILGTAAVYIETFETLTGRHFTLPEGEGFVLDRVRKNLGVS